MKLLDFEFNKHIKLPSKNDEAYKKFDFTGLYSNTYKVKPTQKQSTKQYDYLSHKDFYILFLHNSIQETEKSTLCSHIQYHAINKAGLDSKNTWAQVAQSFIELDNCLHITKSLDKPLLIINTFSLTNSLLCASLNVKLDNNCTADILEVFITNNNGACFLNVNRVFNLAKNATLEYSKSENLKHEDIIVFNYSSSFLNTSTLVINSIDSNCAQILNHWDIVLNSADSIITINALSHIRASENVANIASITHNNINTSSHIQIKHILRDQTKALFEVKTKVNKSALFSKVIQSSTATLLSNEATINANPKLEIYTDNLEAKHSATCGNINEEQLYYLQSRGITKDKSEEMLIESLENEIFLKIKNPLCQSYLLWFRGKTHV